MSNLPPETERRLQIDLRAETDVLHRQIRNLENQLRIHKAAIRLIWEKKDFHIAYAFMEEGDG
jgi:hypothetical protein